MNTHPLIAISVLTTAIAASTAAAQPQSPAEEALPVARLLEAMDSGSFAEREAATIALKSASEIGMADLDRLASRPALSAEQMARLAPVAVEALKRSPRAGLGVQFSGEPVDGPGVRISGTIPEFDASRVLQPRDVLLSINGFPIIESSDARYLIISHDPGDELVIDIERQGEPMTVRARAGSFSELNRGQMVRLAEDDLSRAWQYRVARLRGSEAAAAPAIGSNVTPERWRIMMDAMAAEIDRQIAEAQAEQLKEPPLRGGFRLANTEPRNIESTGFAAGGSSRTATIYATSQFSSEGEQIADKTDEAMLNQRIRDQLLEVQRNFQRLQNPNLPQAQRVIIMQRNEQLQERIRMLTESLRQVRAREQILQP